MSNDCSILQKMPALYKRETAKMPEEPQPVEENVELTTKIFVTTEEEVNDGTRLETSNLSLLFCHCDKDRVVFSFSLTAERCVNLCLQLARWR